MTGANLTHLAEVGSTNDWLLARADTLPDGHWVLTDKQTAGRGRRGRAWNDGAGNLMASVLVHPLAEPPAQQLSFVAALALRTALVAASGAADARIRLKWPNDLLLDGAKVSGILLERSGQHLIIGFGANIAQHPADTERPAISLAAAGLGNPAPLAVVQALMTAFAEYRGLWEAQGFAPIRSRWLEQAAGLGERVVARLGTESIEGRFDGIDADGALALRLDDGSVRAIHAGEVFAL